VKHPDRIPSEIRITGRNLTAVAWAAIWTLLCFMIGALLWLVSPDRGARGSNWPAVGLSAPPVGIDCLAGHLARCRCTGKIDTSIYGPALLCRCGGATIYRRTA